MPFQIKNANKESIEALHQSYMEVINGCQALYIGLIKSVT